MSIELLETGLAVLIGGILLSGLLLLAIVKTSGRNMPEPDPEAQTVRLNLRDRCRTVLRCRRRRG